MNCRWQVKPSGQATLPPPRLALMGPRYALASELFTSLATRSFSRQAIITPSWRRLALAVSPGARKMLACPSGSVCCTVVFHCFRSYPACSAGVQGALLQSVAVRSLPSWP